MKLNTTSEYLLRIMSFMVMEEQGKVITTKELFENLHIPFRYLRKMMINLSKSEFIDSIQGKKGGYRLAKEPKNITLLEIIQTAGEDPLGVMCFFGLEKCELVEKCIMHKKWASVRENIFQVLSNTTLADIKESEHQNFNFNKP
jgi:Rrf2 family protein